MDRNTFPESFSPEIVSRLEALYEKIQSGEGSVPLSTLWQLNAILLEAAGDYSLTFQEEHTYLFVPGEEFREETEQNCIIEAQDDAYLYLDGDMLYLFTLYGCHSIVEDKGFVKDTLRLGLAEWGGGTVRIHLLDRERKQKRSLLCFYKSPEGPLMGALETGPLDMAEFAWNYDEACDAWNARMSDENKETQDYSLERVEDLEEARLREKRPTTYEIIQRMNRLDLYPIRIAEYEELMEQVEWMRVRLDSLWRRGDRLIKRKLAAELAALDDTFNTLKWRQECKTLEELLGEFPAEFISGMKRLFWVKYFNSRKKKEQWEYEHDPHHEFAFNLLSLGLQKNQIVSTDWLSVSPSWASCLIVAGTKLIYLDSEECVPLVEDAGFKDGSLRLEGKVLWSMGTILLTLADLKNDRVRKLLCVYDYGWQVIEVSAPPVETE